MCRTDAKVSAKAPQLTSRSLSSARGTHLLAVEAVLTEEPPPTARLLPGASPASTAAVADSRAALLLHGIGWWHRSAVLHAPFNTLKVSTNGASNELSTYLDIVAAQSLPGFDMRQTFCMDEV